MIPVEMPKANENLTEATLDRWLVKVGDSVAIEQPLCDIITDKAKFELPCPKDGKVLAICAVERSMLPVGYVLCVIGLDGETAPEDIGSKNAALLATHQGAVAAMPAGVGSGVVLKDPSGVGVRATPAARRVAKELGVDLAAVAKAKNISGPVGEKDVRDFAAEQA